MTYVSQWLIEEKNEFNPKTEEDWYRFNTYLYDKYPTISGQTIRRQTKALRDGEYRTHTKEKHYTAMPVISVVPSHYSNAEDFHDKWRSFLQSKETVRIANVQDIHWERMDPAILDILAQLLDAFQPDLVPVMCDVADNVLLSQVSHGVNFREMGYGDFATPVDAAAEVFESVTLQYVEFLNEVVPYAFKPSLLGNHEMWLLRYLANSPAIAKNYFFDSFFKKLLDTGAYWLGDQQDELWLAEHLVMVHGWKASNGNYGSTANAYLRHYGDKVSLMAGHSHRPETVWGKPHPLDHGRNFVNVTGTLGSVTREYAGSRYTSHIHQVSFITARTKDNRGHVVEDVTIYPAETGGYYATYRGDTYSTLEV